MLKKVIDFETKGNVIRLYFGKYRNNEYHGDDWNDRPYEHNAGMVYNEYVVDTKDFFIPFDFEVLTPESDWHYNGNSPFSKNDMKARKCPCLIIVKPEEDGWYLCEYSSYLGSDSENVIKIYFNDIYQDVVQKINFLINERN